MTVRSSPSTLTIDSGFLCIMGTEETAAGVNFTVSVRAATRVRLNNGCSTQTTFTVAKRLCAYL